MDKFVDIKGYEGLYKINKEGVIINKKGKVLKQRLMGGHHKEYWVIDLHNNKKVRTHYVHKLIAEMFIPNPYNLPCVNHKDENKTNNKIENLEWCTVAYNNQYNGLRKRASRKTSKKLLAFNCESGLIIEYDSKREADRQGFSRELISKAIQNNKKYRNYIWYEFRFDAERSINR